MCGIRWVLVPVDTKMKVSIPSLQCPPKLLLFATSIPAYVLLVPAAASINLRSPAVFPLAITSYISLTESATPIDGTAFAGS